MKCYVKDLETGQFSPLATGGGLTTEQLQQLDQIEINQNAISEIQEQLSGIPVKTIHLSDNHTNGLLISGVDFVDYWTYGTGIFKVSCDNKRIYIKIKKDNKPFRNLSIKFSPEDKGLDNYFTFIVTNYLNTDTRKVLALSILDIYTTFKFNFDLVDGAWFENTSVITPTDNNYNKTEIDTMISGLVSATGHTPNSTLATDGEGNVIDVPTTTITSLSQLENDVLCKKMNVLIDGEEVENEEEQTLSFVNNATGDSVINTNGIYYFNSEQIGNIKDIKAEDIKFEGVIHVNSGEKIITEGNEYMVITDSTQMLQTQFSEMFPDITENELNQLKCFEVRYEGSGTDRQQLMLLMIGANWIDNMPTISENGMCIVMLSNISSCRVWYEEQVDALGVKEYISPIIDEKLTNLDIGIPSSNDVVSKTTILDKYFGETTNTGQASFALNNFEGFGDDLSKIKYRVDVKNTNSRYDTVYNNDNSFLYDNTSESEFIKGLLEQGTVSNISGLKEYVIILNESLDDVYFHPLDTLYNTSDIRVRFISGINPETMEKDSSSLLVAVTESSYKITNLSMWTESINITEDNLDNLGVLECVNSFVPVAIDGRIAPLKKNVVSLNEKIYNVSKEQKEMRKITDDMVSSLYALLKKCTFTEDCAVELEKFENAWGITPQQPV